MFMELLSEILCLFSLRMGCGALDYRQQAQQMELRTGGMSASAQVIPDSAHVDTFEQVGVERMQLRAKTTPLIKVEKSCVVVPGNPPVLLLPGEEPPPHVPPVERHLQQVSLKVP